MYFSTKPKRILRFGDYTKQKQHSSELSLIFKFFIKRKNQLLLSKKTKKAENYMAIQKSKKPKWLWKLTTLLQPKKIYRKKMAIKVENHHNLKEIFEEINSQYFSSSLALEIDWAGKGKTDSRSSIRLGCYNMRTQRIKINKILDYPHIPRYFVSFILYHEILHHIYPPVCQLGVKRKIHHPLFKKKEKEFRDYIAAQSFLKDLKKELFTPNPLKKTPEKA